MDSEGNSEGIREGVKMKEKGKQAGELSSCQEGKRQKKEKIRNIELEHKTVGSSAMETMVEGIRERKGYSVQHSQEFGPVLEK